MTVNAITAGASAALLLLALFHDMKSMRIPNLLTVSFFIAGIGYHIAASGIGGGLYALAGAFAGFAPLLTLHLLKGIGAGDVKLFAALGAWIGTVSVLQVLVYTILCAGGIGLFMLFFHRPFGRSMKTGTAAFLMPGIWSKQEVFKSWTRDGLRFPFMLAVVPGALTAWFLSI